jgi:hypothetical protein
VFVLGRKFNAPSGALALCYSKRKWGFAELHKRTILRGRCHDQIASNFSFSVRQVPNALSLSDGPPRLLKIDLGQRPYRGAATEERRQRRKRDAINQNAPHPAPKLIDFGFVNFCINESHPQGCFKISKTLSEQLRSV